MTEPGPTRAQDADGAVVTEWTDPPLRPIQRLIGCRAEDLTTSVAGTRVVPRFPTPMQRRLSGG